MTKPVPLPPVVTSSRRSRLYEESFQDAMRKSPGEWFFVETRSIRPSYPWAKQKIDGLRIATRKNDDGDIDVYAMIDDE